MSFFKELKDGVPENGDVSSIDTDTAVNEETVNESDGIDDLFNVEEILNNKLDNDYSSEDETEADDGEIGAPDPELLDNLFTGEKESEPEQQINRVVRKSETSEEDRNATTVITKGTTINGSIISDCSLDVMGTINGDIECIGKLSISGNVTGNSIASEVFVNTKRLEGSIDSEGSVKIALGTVVIGDIKAGSGVIAGAVKGEIDIAGPVVLDSTAIIKGNVKAKSVQMNNGAVLEGFCSLSYASVNIDDVFD